MFASTVTDLGPVRFPVFTGTRIMMMPFLLEDLASLPPSLFAWRDTVASLVSRAAVARGVAYLTIDEARLTAGEIHRRPGLHVDGLDENNQAGGWGGGGGGWGAKGMLTASTHVGCHAWHQTFRGDPGGDCERLRSELEPAARVVLQPDRVYAFDALTVHESVPMERDCDRQFVRLSMPSTAPWYEGYSVNPMGIRPTGPILPKRVQQMGWRP
jgi:hypothetical protein